LATTDDGGEDFCVEVALFPPANIRKQFKLGSASVIVYGLVSVLTVVGIILLNGLHKTRPISDLFLDLRFVGMLTMFFVVTGLMPLLAEFAKRIGLMFDRGFVRLRRDRMVVRKCFSHPVDDRILERKYLSGVRMDYKIFPLFQRRIGRGVRPEKVIACTYKEKPLVILREPWDDASVEGVLDALQKYWPEVMADDTGE
jgi:hypothetical protein